MVLGSALLMTVVSLCTRPPGAATLARYFPATQPNSGQEPGLIATATASATATAIASPTAAPAGVTCAADIEVLRPGKF
jgi:hypothetical protein